jgi:ribosomal protein S18 acetylase RimI-like enzyme
MQISIRNWNISDLLTIQRTWLDFCRTAPRLDMRLKPESEVAMRKWLLSRFKEPASLGLIAEKEASCAGFLIGRVDYWESMPPIVESRRLGIIDAVYVAEEFRRLKVGTRLVDRALEAMRERGATAVETIYDASSSASSALWGSAGFAPWMVHSCRML